MNDKKKVAPYLVVYNTVSVCSNAQKKEKKNFFFPHSHKKSTFFFYKDQLALAPRK